MQHHTVERRLEPDLHRAGLPDGVGRTVQRTPFSPRCSSTLRSSSGHQRGPVRRLGHHRGDDGRGGADPGRVDDVDGRHVRPGSHGHRCLGRAGRERRVTVAPHHKGVARACCSSSALHDWPGRKGRRTSARTHMSPATSRPHREQHRRLRLRERGQPPRPRRAAPPGRRRLARRHGGRSSPTRSARWPRDCWPRGIQTGDRVAVMSKTRYEWTLADFALFTVGAVVVPIYETSSAEQVEWILSDAGAKARVRRDRRARRHRRIGAGQHPGTGRGLAVRGRRDRGPDRRRRGRQRRRGDQAARVGDPRRPGLDHLHLGHHRAAQGLPAQPPQLRHRGRRTARRARATSSTRTPRRCCSCRSRTSSAGPSRSARSRPGCTLGHTADVKNLLDDLAELQADVRAGRAPRVREGLQHGQAARARHGQGQDLRPGRARRDRVQRGDRRRPVGRAAACGCSTRSSTGWCTASCGPPSAATASPRSRAARRWARGSGTSSAASASRSTRATA